MQLSDAFDLGKAATATLKRQKVALDQVRADTGLRAKITASVLRKAIKDGFLWDGLKVRVQAWGPSVLVELWALAEPDTQKQLSGLFSIVQSESGRAVVNIAPELEISRQRANIILRNLTSPQGQPPLKNDLGLYVGYGTRPSDGNATTPRYPADMPEAASAVLLAFPQDMSERPLVAGSRVFTVREWDSIVRASVLSLRFLNDGLIVCSR